MQLLVTGAANGIGASVTELATQQGHKVIATDLDITALKQRWENQPSVRSEALDVRDEGQWRSLIRKLESEGQTIDVLANVAGVLRSGRTGNLKGEDVHLMLDVNVQGAILGANAAAAHMIAHGIKGHIINVGSIASLYATSGTTIYAASKFAVRGFSIAAAGDLRPHGIAVSLVGPGPVKTGMLEQQRGDDNAALTFSGLRALTTQEVAETILGPVLAKRPLECFLPWHEGIVGKICNLMPGLFLYMTRRAFNRGRKNFSSDNF
ncbi:SDR family NAD(P)-dependent oxidoreductase [Marinobacter sp.]|uniref:SDR family NAD(P)-dependent oxidoreductase n=1 Tax=Marinobacter sp. TaxID=50741 RepID=UPI003A8EF04D